MKKQIITILALLAMSSCAPAKPSKLEFDENPDFQRTNRNNLPKGISFSDVSQKVLKPLNCLQCHGDMKSEKGFSSYIKSGEPFSSKAYLRMENQTMPPFGTKATKDQLEILEAYISDFNN